MGTLDAPTDELTAIEEGRASARPAEIRIVEVRGSEAAGWLHDLVTTDVASLEPGQARRSLLLTPTGRIRADFMVGRDGDGFVLLQRTDQPRAIDDLLSVYVLSSDVNLIDRTPDRSIWTLVASAADRAEGDGLSPSLLGPGRDLLVHDPGPDPPVVMGLDVVGESSLEVWRVRRGAPRMGVDFDEGALPAEAGVEDTIDITKGCFLGQESVAKIRNLGHPPHLLRHLSSEAAVAPGTPLFDGHQEVGTVTSAVAAPGGGTVVIARVAWRSRAAVLTSPERVPMAPVGQED